MELSKYFKIDLYTLTSKKVSNEEQEETYFYLIELFENINFDPVIISLHLIKNTNFSLN